MPAVVPAPKGLYYKEEDGKQQQSAQNAEQQLENRCGADAAFQIPKMPQYLRLIFQILRSYQIH